jgi:hypothetical protein
MRAFGAELNVDTECGHSLEFSSLYPLAARLIPTAPKTKTKTNPIRVKTREPHILGFFGNQEYGKCKE